MTKEYAVDSKTKKGSKYKDTRSSCMQEGDL